MIDMRLISYFIEVAKYLNFTKAAEALFISQPSLSRQIMELENELGVKLFVRSNHQVKLTAAGEVLLKEGSELINRLDVVIEKTRKAGAGMSGDLIITSAAPNNTVLLDVVKGFNNAFPAVSVNISFHLLGSLVETLLQDKMDVGYTTAFEIDKVPFLDFIPFREVNFCALLPADHPLSGRDAIEIGELEKEDFIFYDDAGFSYFRNLCAQAGFMPKVAHIIKSPITLETLLLQVEIGMGITFIPSNFHWHDRPYLQKVSIKGCNAKSAMGFAWKKSNEKSTLKTFLDYVRSIVNG